MFTVGLGELARPFAGGCVERDVDAFEAVTLELVLEQAPEGLVEVREHRVERHIDGQHEPTLTSWERAV